MSIAKNIKQLRERHGLSQKELADIAGVTDKAVSTWEVGKKTPRMNVVDRMSAYFNIPKSRILDDHGLYDDSYLTDINLAEIEFAIYGQVKKFDNERKKQVLEYIKFLKQQQEKENTNDNT